MPLTPESDRSDEDAVRSLGHFPAWMTDRAIRFESDGDSAQATESSLDVTGSRDPPGSGIKRYLVTARHREHHPLVLRLHSDSEPAPSREGEFCGPVVGPGG
jgi:hypothetical protein